MTDNKYRIAIIGGTGAEGSGLAIRWAKAGHQIIIGSRDAAKAQAVAADLNGRLNSSEISGATFADAAKAAEIVVLTVPFAAQISTVETLRSHLQGKILIDVTVPLVPPKVSQVQLPSTDSCVVAVQNTLGDGVRVVSAFQNVSAHKLKDLNYEVQCDVLVCGNDKDARQLVIGLARDAGLRGIDAGLLVNSTVAESLTSVLIWINRTYKIPDAGIAITGIA
jgi:8-hydroxy-5-deazaflavin:NADPH oxidoreductase